MAGHSKWSNIKHKKAIQDNKRSKIFTRLIREITIATKLRGSKPTSNPRLRIAIATAYSYNMKKDCIEKAIRKGLGKKENKSLEEICYEGYGPAGTAFIIECMTDNRNRTAAEIRHVFSRLKGKLGATGSVKYMFHKKGIISFSVNSDEYSITEVALQYGAKDIIHSDASIDVITDPNQLFEIREAFNLRGFNILATKVTLDAKVKIPIHDVELSKKITKIINYLEELDSVQSVYNNALICT